MLENLDTADIFISINSYTNRKEKPIENGGSGKTEPDNS